MIEQVCIVRPQFGSRMIPHRISHHDAIVSIDVERVGAVPRLPFALPQQLQLVI